MRFEPIKIGSNLSMGTTCTSTGVYLDQIVAWSAQAVWTGKPVGTLDVQVSNDIVQINPTVLDPAAQVTNWTSYTGALQSLTGSGAAGSFVWNAAVAGYSWLRCIYTQSSGTGTLNITFAGKG